MNNVYDLHIEICLKIVHGIVNATYMFCFWAAGTHDMTRWVRATQTGGEYPLPLLQNPLLWHLLIWKRMPKNPSNIVQCCDNIVHVCVFILAYWYYFLWFYQFTWTINFMNMSINIFSLIYTCNLCGQLHQILPL